MSKDKKLLNVCGEWFNIKNMLFMIVPLFIVFVDLLTKQLTINVSFSVIGDLLWFESVKNTGASFGVLKGKSWLFISLAIIVVFMMFFLIMTDKYTCSKLCKISLGVMMGGIIGNLVDRIKFGYVRDFIYLKFIDFAVFNVADMCICVGTVLIAVYILFLHNKVKGKTQENMTKKDVGNK